MERVWLKATELGLSVHPISAPILLGLLKPEGVFGPQEQDEINMLYERTLRAFDLGGRLPLFMMRLAYAGEPSVRSLRRPLSEIYSVGNLIKA